MLYNTLSEEIFPNIQSRPPLEQHEAISSRPITCYLGKETDIHLTTISFQVVVETHKVSLLSNLQYSAWRLADYSAFVTKSFVKNNLISSYTEQVILHT